VTPRLTQAGPTQNLAASIRKLGVRVLGMLRWGLIPYWSKDPKIA
jgi:putative SOS response-associated peptidase YedK